MSAEEFKQKVGQLLGVSSTERDMALDILLNKAADILEFFDAVKVRGLGVFQFRKDDLGNVDQNSILFVPAGALKSPGKKFMYLTLKVNRTDSNDLFDENLFSPGIGKKIISPDESLEKAGGPEALRKHIEDKVDEILADSEQLEDFDIWKNYNLTGDEEETAEFSFANEESNKINFDEIAEEFSFEDLDQNSDSGQDSPEVSEFDFEEEVDFDAEEDNTQIENSDEIEFHDFDENISTSETDENEISFENEDDNLPDDDEHEEPENSGSDYLESSIDIDFDFEKLNSGTQVEDEEAPVSDDQEIKNEVKEVPASFEPISLDEFNLEEDEGESESDEDWFSFDEPEDDIKDEDESEEPEVNSGEKPIPDEDAWDWGDELDEDQEKIEIIEPAEEDEIEEESEHREDEDSLFQTLEREITEIKDEPVEEESLEPELDDDEENDKKEEPEFDLPPIIEVKEDDSPDKEAKEEEIEEEKPFLPSKDDVDDTEEETEGEGNFDKKTWEEIYKDFEFDDIKKGSKKDQLNNLKSKTVGNKLYSRNMLIIIVVLLILALATIYFYLFYESDEGYQPGSTPVTENRVEENQTDDEEFTENNGNVDQKLDDIIAEQENQSQPEETLPVEEPPVRNNPPVSNVEETKPKVTPGGIYLDFAAASQVKHLIFRLNNEYYVQVASVRNAKSAEREAQRLRRLGQTAYVSESFIKSKNATYYRVKRGPFNSLSEAETYSAGLK
ncbi:MAG: hypothetical protein SCALA702_09590 [Melioribacteraceae bacterium]|nr:MAG: hypothetical protein SCALA702_09590 [Melioribacteraceae bacterium]